MQTHFDQPSCERVRRAIHTVGELWGHCCLSAARRWRRARASSFDPLPTSLADAFELSNPKRTPLIASLRVGSLQAAAHHGATRLEYFHRLKIRIKKNKEDCVKILRGIDGSDALPRFTARLQAAAFNLIPKSSSGIHCIVASVASWREASPREVAWPLPYSATSTCGRYQGAFQSVRGIPAPVFWLETVFPGCVGQPRRRSQSLFPIRFLKTQASRVLGDCSLHGI